MDAKSVVIGYAIGYNDGLMNGTGGGSSGDMLGMIDNIPTLAEVEIGDGWSIKIKITNTISYLNEKYSNDGLSGYGDQYPQTDIRGWTWLICFCKGGIQWAKLQSETSFEDTSRTIQVGAIDPETKRVNTIVDKMEWFSDFSVSNSALGVTTEDSNLYYAGCGTYHITFDVTYTQSGFVIPDPINKPTERTESSSQGTISVELYFTSNTLGLSICSDNLDGAQRRDIMCDFYNAYYKNHILPYSKKPNPLG